MHTFKDNNSKPAEDNDSRKHIHCIYHNKPEGCQPQKMAILKRENNIQNE